MSLLGSKAYWAYWFIGLMDTLLNDNTVQII